MYRITIILCAILAIIVIIALARESRQVVTIPEVIVPTAPVFDEAKAVEAYIRRAKLEDITGESPVLGGTLYITELTVDTIARTVSLSYEDGHIDGSGIVPYAFDETTGTVTILGFTKDT